MRDARVIQLMTAMGLLDWQAVMVGWDHRWLSKADVVHFAVDWLLRDPDDNRVAVALLAGGEECGDDEIRRLLVDVIDDSQADEGVTMDKWRLAFLSALAEKDLGWECKVTLLEEIGAAFGAPADMRLCTRYGPSERAIKKGLADASDLTVDPLDAMAKVIANLKRRFNVG
jgi:hypothetical protein